LEYGGPESLLKASGCDETDSGRQTPTFGVKIQNQKGKNIFLDALLPPKQRAPITIKGKLLKIVQYNSQMQTSKLTKSSIK